MKKQTETPIRQASEMNGSEKASELARIRAQKLSPERRSEIASIAAKNRWTKPQNREGILKEEYPGTLYIRDLELPCAVLNNKVRVLSERGVTKALGGKRGGSHWQRIQDSEDYLPVFLSAKNLAPYIPPSLRISLSQPIAYQSKHGSIAYGVPASLIPEICDVFLRARREKALTDPQAHLAMTAEILVSALAQVGIIALVDEATGYQEVRDRDELHRILEAYISPELAPWTKRFPDEFYKQLFRLRGWSYNPSSVKRPKMVGKLTAQIIYERLPPGVLEGLRKKNPVTKPGGVRRHKLFQYLTADTGDPHLDSLLLQVIPLMRGSTTWRSFEGLLERAIPKPKLQQELDLLLPPVEDEED